MNANEQICRDEKSPKYRKWLKRTAKRLFRRLWKQQGEDAPKHKQWKGYST